MNVHPIIHRILIIAVTALTCIGSVQAQQIDYKGFPQWSWQKEDSTEYYLYTPSNLEPGRRYPIALFMHGCCGEDYHATLRNAVDPPIRMWHNFGANTQDIPTYLIAPKTSRGWSQHFGNLKKVMDRLVSEQQGDPGRIYVCGFSMGGNGTFSILQRYPGYFAAAIPMGMSFRGDSTLIKDVPIWANQGETDWFARNLARQIGDIRALNGLKGDNGQAWITGVNPRYSNFKSIGHGVQWIAASTQDLTGWAYGKINDGNTYPVVFFEGITDRHIVQEGEPFEVRVHANDPDGTIDRVELFLDHTRISGKWDAPYAFSVTPHAGDNLLEAVVYDNKGKSGTAIIRVKTDTKPQIRTAGFPDAHAGKLYRSKIEADGNGALQFQLVQGALPPGIQLYPDGTIRGMAMKKGEFQCTVRATDEDAEFVERAFTLSVRKHDPGTVLVTDVFTVDGKAYPISEIMIGETPNFNSLDSVLSTDPEEINFSFTGDFELYAYIKTDIQDANREEENFLSFTVSEDVIVYVAYEKLDNILRSGVPDWLASYTRQPGEIVAQYRYYGVYGRAFAKGKITLPGAGAKASGVGTNYFIMIRKAP